MLPLQMPIPGGVELLVILLVLVVLFGVPLVLLGGGYLLFRRRREARLAELEARIDELEHEGGDERADERNPAHSVRGDGPGSNRRGGKT